MAAKTPIARPSRASIQAKNELTLQRPPGPARPIGHARPPEGCPVTDFPWLSAALLLPILGAVVVSLLPARDGDLPKKVALGA